ncbi:hypothetical protein AC249_AIPGENE5427 [Exaiptasia diaphana]|nr:hypothetical protein AC249_AIPGENE5427 [Exaiptasia diaphana]
MEFYRKVMTGRGANGTEGIVHVEVTVLEDYFIIYPMKACIINCQQLMPRRLPDNNTNLPTIHQNCQYMLLLPDEFPRKNIKGIQAGLFDIKEKQLERLTLMGYEHVVEVFNHRCLPLEPTRIPKHVSKYSKTIQQIKSPTELSDQLFGVGGDHSSDKTRPEFVKLKFITADENAQRDVLEICDKGDVLYPRGILLHGKETKSKHNGKETKSKYNVKVIGSYSCKKGKITYKCILDKDINSGDEIDHGKEENAYSEHAKGI